MNRSAEPLLAEIEAALVAIRQQIFLNGAILDGSVELMLEGEKPEIKIPESTSGDFDAAAFIGELEKHLPVERYEADAAIEAALIKGKAEGATWAADQIVAAIERWNESSF